ncbi:HD domain-containing protein [Cellulosilyticum sp. I15G10I2]|uniref:HD domain-containing protein n=1 Tax=Cellulosilyticum sp. I15G10I2 TaxID=1892843 RepID=UPI00085BB69A|nr:HD domain-containing protein [Cellulosilyticum sp. I15G10I2]
MIYRIKQFFQGLAANINEQDKVFINNYLNEKEQRLFFQLRLSEQYHSLKVAYGCFKCLPQSRSLIRSALLHDIGKVGSNLNLINKSLVVLAKKLNIKHQLLPEFLQRAMYYKKEHPVIGYRLLLAYDLDPRELLLIKDHHHFKKEQTIEMQILQCYDNKF